jgi:hypothetical protein
MHEKLNENLVDTSDVLRPGNIIEFDSIDEIPAFEDMVAKHIDKDQANPIQWRTWDHRVFLPEFVRPLGTNGSISDVRLEVLENPMLVLMSQKERGMRNVDGCHGMPTKYSDESLQIAINKSIGFRLIANVNSSGSEPVEIEAEIIYTPAPNSSRKSSDSLPVRRYGAVSKEQKTFFERKKTSYKLAGAAIMSDYNKSNPRPSKNSLF